MPTPPPLARDPLPAGHVHRRDPVVALTTLLLVVLMACLLVIAVMVATSYGIVTPGTEATGTISAGTVWPLVLVAAGVFLAVIVLNVAAASVRHFRPGRG